MNLSTISDGHGLRVQLLDYGARIARIQLGELDLCARYPNVLDYASDPFYLGATIGPITNRIASSRLTIGDQTFELPANEGKNCLHSGGKGFDKKNWRLVQSTADMLEYELIYDLAELGMLGRMHTTARYSVDNGALTIGYSSRCDTDTYVNLTNHVYLNLGGKNQAISDHQFKLYADSYAQVTDDSIPTGKLLALDSPFNYSIKANSGVSEFDGQIDHHFHVDSKEPMPTMIEAFCETSGVKLAVNSNSPGFHFYTAASLSDPFVPSGAFCVETQIAPDAINQPNFESPLLLAGQVREQRTVLNFTARV